MKVFQITDRIRVQPNCVYTIPPNQDLSILHGVLHLLTPISMRGQWLPIDFFFRALAEDQQQHSIGVILSGLGSDGTLGLRAIKDKAGLVIVQEAITAKFDSMPRSAIEAGLADIVAPAGELPERILAHLQHKPLIVQSGLELDDKSQSALGKVILLLRSHTGNDFSLYKRNTLYRRIERRMGIHQIGKMAVYVRYLQENPQELDLLYKELLIGVTNFFRDPAVWSELRTKILPELLATRVPGQTLRAWVPGCSTGKEAYSLAMIFKEAVEASSPMVSFAFQIFATDLDQDAIDQARLGLYPTHITADVSPERLARFFSKEDLGYRVRREIREMVVFATQNIIMDPPFTKLDFLSCRNLFIYLTAEVQKKLLSLFHFSLVPGGILLLGSAETVGSSADLFTAISGKSRLFQRAEPRLHKKPIEFPSSYAVAQPIKTQSSPSSMLSASLQSQVDQWILQHHAPPAVLTNNQGDIFYINGRTGKYLEPAAGKANWNLFVMARPGLSHVLRSAIEKAQSQKEGVKVKGLKVGTDGGVQHVYISLQQLDQAGPLHGLILILFTDVVVAAKSLKKQAARDINVPDAMEQELLRVRAEARANQEEMQTSQEEVRSANEELQSTNEELTTSKEEMQSLNEELQTVNTELQAKVDELSRASNDMKNLLESTDIATLFLDHDLHVRRFTHPMTKIIKLIPTDVGRPITDLVSHLNESTLAADVRQVLLTLASMEKPVSSADGRWFSLRIMPYRTIEDRIDGVVMTFTDITVAKTLEAELRSQHANLEAHLARQQTQSIHPSIKDRKILLK
jgi:two-component system CheB/CheR fusion protein